MHSNDKMPLDVLALKKRISRTAFDPAACAILSSLLVYLTDRADGPPEPPAAQRAEGRESRPNCRPEPLEPYRRPTKFQLLQSKFMNTNREPYIKKTREVGRLIFKDKQGPSRSFVNTTISKLLERTKEKASSPGEEKRPFSSEKPRWGHPAGKNTVKNILKMFMAAEEKEAKDKEARERPPAARPKAAGGFLPRIVSKKNSVLSKLREKFEQSSSLCSEASVLLLRKEERKKKNLQRKKMHRPEVRVLHTATMASTCMKSPLGRYLACTAEPVPAFNIATIVCSPRSWLSHSTRISHSTARQEPRESTSLSSNAGEVEPIGNQTPKRPLSGQLEGQLEGLQDLMSTVNTPVGAQAALRTPAASAELDRVPGLSSPPAITALPEHIPVLAPLSPASPRNPGLAGCDQTRGLLRDSATEGIQEAGSRVDFPPSREAEAGPSFRSPNEAAGEIPEMTMTVCSSEDEIETTADSERDQIFAIQKCFPEQKVPEHIPPLTEPAVQAARRTQSTIEPPQITVKLPVVYEMPPLPVTLQNVPSDDDKYTPNFGGENVVETVQTLFPTGTENKRDDRATVNPGKPSGVPVELNTSSKQASHAALKPPPLSDAAGFDRPTPVTVLAAKPHKSSTGMLESKCSFEKSSCLLDQSAVSRAESSEFSYEKHELPESNAIAITNSGTSSNESKTWENSLRGNVSSTSDIQPRPSSNQTNRTGVSTVAAEAAKECGKPESSAMTDQSILLERSHKRTPLTGFAQSLNAAEGNATHDSGKDRLSSLNGIPKLSTQASQEMTAVGSCESRTVPSPADTLNAENKMTTELNADGKEQYRIPSTGHSVMAGNSLVEDLPWEPKKYHFLTPNGSSKHKVSRAAERAVLNEAEGRPSPTCEHLMICPGEVADSHRAFDKPQTCVSNELSESKRNVSVKSKNNVTMEENLLSNNMESQTLTSDCFMPQEKSVPGSSHYGVGQQQSPSWKPQAKDKMTVVPEKQPVWGTENFHQFPVMLSTDVECVNGATEGQKYPNLQTWLLPSTKDNTDVPEVKNLGSKVEESQLALRNLGSQENHCEEKNPSSQARLPQTPQPDECGKKKIASLSQPAMLCAATEPEIQSPTGLEKNNMVSPGVNSCQPTRKGQEHLPGESVKHVNNPTQSSRCQSVKMHLAQTGSSEKPGSLASQGTQVKESKMAPPDLEQPLISTVEAQPTGGKDGKHQRPAPSDGWKKERETYHKAKESQPNTSRNKAFSSEELPKPFFDSMKASVIPTPDSGGCQTPQVCVQEGLSDNAGNKEDLWNKRDTLEYKQHRKLTHFAKYKAQSFCDQRSFDLSFRPTILKANNAFELPKEDVTISK